MRIDRNATPTADSKSDKLRRRMAFDPKAVTPAYVIVIRFAVVIALVLLVAEVLR